MSHDAAEAIVAQVQAKPDSLLILPTGATPERTFELLVERGRSQPGFFAQVRILKLDEWGGLAMDDPATCETYLRRNLTGPLGIGEDRFFGWQSQPRDVAAECRRVAAWLEANGPADICLLGLGVNGHLGFNEPDDVLVPGPHRAELSAESRGHSMLANARNRPECGLTLGMRDLLRSRQVFLLVSGAHKRAQLERLLRPEIASQAPASFLWLHPDTTVFCDAAARP